jgi:hypothetical protein
MTIAARRAGPLAVRIGTRQLTLPASDVSELIAAAESCAGSFIQGRVSALTTTLALTPSRFGDPPLELDNGQRQVLQEVLDEMKGRPGGLSPSLRELKLALESLRRLPPPPRAARTGAPPFASTKANGPTSR